MAVRRGRAHPRRAGHRAAADCCSTATAPTVAVGPVAAAGAGPHPRRRAAGHHPAAYRVRPGPTGLTRRGVGRRRRAAASPGREAARPAGLRRRPAGLAGRSAVARGAGAGRAVERVPDGDTTAAAPPRRRSRPAHRPARGTRRRTLRGPGGPGLAGTPPRGRVRRRPPPGAGSLPAGRGAPERAARGRVAACSGSPPTTCYAGPTPLSPWCARPWQNVVPPQQTTDPGPQPASPQPPARSPAPSRDLTPPRPPARHPLPGRPRHHGRQKAARRHHGVPLAARSSREWNAMGVSRPF